MHQETEMKTVARYDDPRQDHLMDTGHRKPQAANVEPGPGTRSAARLILGDRMDERMNDRQLRVAAVAHALRADVADKSDAYLESALTNCAKSATDLRLDAVRREVAADVAKLTMSSSTGRPAGQGASDDRSRARASQAKMDQRYSQGPSMSSAEARKGFLARRYGQ
jgi:hypothetical protein